MLENHVLSLKVPLIFKSLWDKDFHQIVEAGGRLSGKTANAIIYACLDMLSHPYGDWIVFRAKFASFRTTDYEEVMALIRDNGLGKEFHILGSPLKIMRRKNAGTIYFMGADSIGTNDNRTHGIKTSHHLRGVIFSETQEFRTENAFNQACASVRRNFTTKDGQTDPDWKIIVQYNPPQSEGFWINRWANRVRFDPDWHFIEPSYLDILPFINDIDLRDIRKNKREDLDHYDWFYRGKVGGGIEGCYPMLNFQEYCCYRNQAEERSKHRRVVALIIGCDGAVDRDCTSFVTCALTEDGDFWVSSRDLFHYDPKKSGVMASWPLCDQGGPAWKWFYGWEGIGCHYQGICERYPSLNGMSVPIFMFYDSAAPELGQSLRFHFGKRCNGIYPVSKGTIVGMVDCVRGVLAKKRVHFIMDNGYWDFKAGARLPAWVLGKFHPPYDQAKMLRMDETGLKYDDTIPNDDSDALTYAIWSWFKNPANISFGDFIRL